MHDCNVIMARVPHRGGCDHGQCDEYTTQHFVRATTRRTLPHLARYLLQGSFNRTPLSLQARTIKKTSYKLI